MKNSNEQLLKTKKYKIKILSTAAWRNFNECRLQISVGHGDKHEGEKFATSLIWAKDNFDKVIICVNDTLQRYNLMSKGINEKTAYTMAYEAGNKWIAKNIKEQSAKVEIIRWDYWLKHKDFNRTFNLINDFYINNDQFKQNVEKTAFNFLFKKKLQQDDHKKNNSIEYLIEEVAAFPLMAEKNKAIDVYPGTILPQFKMLVEGKIEGIQAIENVNFTKIDFLRNI